MDKMDKMDKMDDERRRNTEITTITPSEYGEAPGAGVETEKPVQPIAEGTAPLARENGKADYPKPAWQQDNRPKETAVQPSPSPSTNGDTSDDVDKELRGALILIDQQIDALKKRRAEYDRYNETDEQRKTREKREKSRRLVSAIGDTLKALSGMYFASRYAPAVKIPRTYDKEVERQDKLRAEREAGKDAFLNYTLKIAELERDKDKTLRDIRAKAASARIEANKDEREQQEHNWLAALQPDRLREQAGKANKAEQEAVKAKVEADNAPEYYEARTQAMQAQVGVRNSQVGLNKSRAAKVRSGGGSGGSGYKYPAKGRDGKLHYFRTVDEANSYAISNGTYVPSTTVTNSVGNGVNSTKTSTTTKGHRDLSTGKGKNSLSRFSIH